MNVREIVENPYKIFESLAKRGYLNGLADKVYIKFLFRSRMGRWPNLKNPKTFNEKLQWLKLHDRKPIYTTLVDKYAVKQYVAERIGEDYIIPTLGVWEKFDDIDFDTLPDQFVLKCTHDSGGLVICKSKKDLDIDAARNKIEKCLKRNFYWHGREWPYKNVPQRIICEKYMTDGPDTEEFTDYKFYCFHGTPDSVLMCVERFTSGPKFYFFDKQWELKRYNLRGKNAPADFTLPKPSCMDEMFQIAEKLSQGIPYVRVDLYQSNDRVYFGEMTFYPSSGFDADRLPETDRLFGDLVDLSVVQDL